MPTKESRHTCAVCGAKRIKTYMQQISRCHTGAIVWVCYDNPYIFKSDRCSFKFKPGLGHVPL